MRAFCPLLMIISSATSAFSQAAEPLSLQQNQNGRSKVWFDLGSQHIESATKRFDTHDNKRGAAKNIILFIGDGMGLSTVTAARILDGQLKGGRGEENRLTFEQFPYTGFSKTYNTNQQTPDSAGTATALLTGVKTKAGMINIGDDSERANCQMQKKYELVSALELAHLAGKSTGVVTTTAITHATPATAYAKSSNRDWEVDSKLSAEAEANGCKDIASQLVDSAYVDVAMGGGRSHFLPKSFIDDEGAAGKREDNQNLIQTWQQKTGGVYVSDQKSFDRLPENSNKVLALFNPNHMRYEQDRLNDTAGEPSLAEMTTKTIKLLQNNPNGFFMLVEGGRIDHAHHAGNAYNALHETIALDRAVAAAQSLTSAEDTLLIVTADHSHVFTIAGYPTRGNPILGKVIGNNLSGQPKTSFDTVYDKKPYTTLGYTNGLGFRDFGQELNADASYQQAPNVNRQDLTKIDTKTPGYHQETAIPRGSETHGGEDVGIYASGPGAALIVGTLEQNIIFHVMEHAGNLTVKPEQKKWFRRLF